MDIHAELSRDGETLLLMPDDGDVYSLRTSELALLTPLIKLTDDRQALYLPLSWPAVVQLAMTYGSRLQPGDRLKDWIGEESERRTDAVGPEPIMYGLLGTLPERLRPRPYQYAGARMVSTVGKALITDEPGTGKTITTILGLLQRGHLGVAVWPTLVVCPASVVDSWVEAWQSWAPDVRVVAWRGQPAQRRGLGASGYEVYVASYDTARIDEEHLLALGLRAVVVDECHMIKSPGARRTKAVRRLTQHAETVVALSGTPITHHPGDLWPTLTCISPTAWPSRERWVSRYCLTIPGDYGEQIIGLKPAAEPEFRATLMGQMRRVAKADVLHQLPPKVYSVRTVDLPREYRKAYDAMEKDMLAALPDGGELAAPDMLSTLGRLVQLSSAAADVTVTYETDPDTGLTRPHYAVQLKAPSWKVDALLEVLEERPGSPVVAFAPSKQLVTLAGRMASERGYNVGYVVGGQSAKDRTADVQAFQAGKLDLLCVTTGAGGTGITLTAAATVVFLQRPWSLVESSQAEDRCHRIGSEIHESIEIIDINATNTIDTRIRAKLRDKASNLSDLVKDPRIVEELLGGKRKRGKAA